MGEPLFNMNVPRTTDVDWNLARNLFSQGLTLAEIARRLGCSAGTLRSRSHREKWGELAAKTQEVLKKEPFDPVERAQTWRKRLSAVIDRKLDHLESRPLEEMTMKDLLMATQIEELSDKMMRRTLEMDGANASKEFSVAMTLNVTEVLLPGDPGTEIPAIEVESSIAPAEQPGLGNTA